MKVSLNSILQMNAFYKTTGDVAAIGIDRLVEKIGAQLGAVDEVTELGSKYDGVVVAKVVSCEKHPDADKLSVCMIDAGKGDHVQVVCGAPNVAAGQTVAWIPPGVTVPETAGKDPFVLEAREIRGVVSNGMLASPKELALGDGHEGILVLDDYLKPGQDFAEAVGLKGDYVIDIENKMFTHRPDCFGYLGIARELAGIQQMAFKSPDWYVPVPAFPKTEGEGLPLKVENQLGDLVPRFSAITMNNVQVGPSPVWLVVELAKLGQKSINNIVDLTNYLMILTGQPLHAYDYDKVKALSGHETTIVVRKAKKDEKVRLLNGKEVEPPTNTIMIATDKQAIGLGGVMGGSETEVGNDTKNIIIECANFDMYATRRASMALGLFTDAVTRFSKGQSPIQTLAVLAKMVEATADVSGAKVAGEVIDVLDCDKINAAGDGWNDLEVRVTPEFINSRLGLALTADEILGLLHNVEFGSDRDGDELVIYSPFWRTDIEIPEDIVEEVGRLYGYDHLPLELPKRDLTAAAKDPVLTAKASLRQGLSRAGANEVLTYSFVHGDLLRKAGQDPKQAFEVANALSPDLQYYRLSLLPSLLEKVHPNIKAGHDAFVLFEIGKAHIAGKHDEDGLPLEFERLALVVADKKPRPGAAYYGARAYLDKALAAFGLDATVTFEPLKDEKDVATPYYQPGRSATVKLDGKVVGRIGEFRSSVRRALKLPEHCAGFELGLAPLMEKVRSGAYAPLSRFPSVKQDMTLKVPRDLAYADLHALLSKALAQAAPDKSLIRFECVGIYRPEDGKHKNVTFRFTINSYERTLTDAEVNKVLDAMAAEAKTALKAERV